MTKYCNQDYPQSFVDYAAVLGTTVGDGVVTSSAADGAISYKSYCDGGAAILAVATTAAAAATVSLY
jgi:hypothetical protein